MSTVPLTDCHTPLHMKHEVQLTASEAFLRFRLLPIELMKIKGVPANRRYPEPKSLSANRST